MKFKVDENLPIEVAQLLREAGHDVYSVHEQGLVGAKDHVLAEVCQSENRAMVTLDTHFADIRTYPPGNYSGLIVLRLARQDKAHVLESCAGCCSCSRLRPLKENFGLSMRKGCG